MQNNIVYGNLQRHLNQLPAGFPASRSGAEIRILQQLFSPVEARIATKLSILPMPLSLIFFRGQDLNLTKPRLLSHLEQMVKRGLIIRRRIGRLRLYQNAKFIIGIYELQGLQLTRELMESLNRYRQEALARDFMVNGGVSQIRTIPVEQSISEAHQLLSYDDLQQLLKKCKPPIGITKCACREGQKLLGHPCKQTTVEEACFTFGPVAKYWIDNGFARAISRKEAQEILRHCQADGLVLQPGNGSSLNFICTCCGCCCQALQILRQFPRPVDHYQVNYVAEVRAKDCKACGLCVSRCQMGALELREKSLKINFPRCIGCGQCAITCPSKAIRLRPKEKRVKPPRNTLLLNFRLLLRRWGVLKTLKSMIAPER